MYDTLNQIFSFIASTLLKVFNTYVLYDVLSGFFALWILDRIFHIFDIIKR